MLPYQIYAVGLDGKFLGQESVLVARDDTEACWQALERSPDFVWALRFGRAIDWLFSRLSKLRALPRDWHLFNSVRGLTRVTQITRSLLRMKWRRPDR